MRLILSIIIILIMFTFTLSHTDEGSTNRYPTSFDIFVTISNLFRINSGSFKRIYLRNINIKYDVNRLAIKDYDPLICNKNIYGTIESSSSDTTTYFNDVQKTNRTWKHKWNKSQGESKFKCFHVDNAVLYEFKSNVTDVNTKMLCESMCSILINNSKELKHRDFFLKKMKLLFEKFGNLKRGEIFSLIVVKSKITDTFNRGDIILIPSINDSVFQYSEITGTFIDYKIKTSNAHDKRIIYAVYGKDCPVCADTFIKTMNVYLNKHKKNH